jgi:hypothetical protein
MNQVKAIPCDIYSRVVGYYTRVSDWNYGKKEEFAHRSTMTVKDMTQAAYGTQMERSDNV